DEAGVIAERASYEDVLSAGERRHRRQLRDRVRAEKRVEPTDEPDREKRPGGREPLRNFAGSAEDAGADDVADRHGQTEGHAEDGEQPARRMHRRSVTD